MKTDTHTNGVHKARKALGLTKGKRVSLDDSNDFEAIHLGALGLSSKFIISETGLTPHQISYRLHKFGVRRMDARNGNSSIIRELLKIGKKKTRGMLRFDLESYGELRIGNGHE